MITIEEIEKVISEMLNKELKEEIRKIREDPARMQARLQELKGRTLVDSRELYEIRKIMGIEHCTYRHFMRKIKSGGVIYRYIEVPHPYNKRQWKRLFDITDHEEEVMAYIYQSKLKKHKVTIEIDSNLYQYFKEKANKYNWSVEDAIVVALNTLKPEKEEAL